MAVERNIKNVATKRKINKDEMNILWKRVYKYTCKNKNVKNNQQTRRGKGREQIKFTVKFSIFKKFKCAMFYFLKNLKFK